MTGKQSEMVLKPIGFVRNEIKELGRRDWEDVVSEIVIDSRLTDALDGLEEFSHIIVLFWMHRVTESNVPLKVHPRGNRNLPLVGLFATRAPTRPNRIGETTVKLLERRENILRVKGLDAIDSTPVIDIKPFIPRSDLPDGIKVPNWINKL
jgi:tRNA-Thr(GGU) m(6)t(6)A37 methyltransferase TsaA